MAFAGSSDWRALLQEFADARLDAAQLFARAEKLLPAGSDTSEHVLELLAEGDLKLRPPEGRAAFVQRLEQFAGGESSYAELDLWCFTLWQTGVYAPDAPASADPETALLQTVLGWIAEWEDEEVRPDAAAVAELARILESEPDPAACLERLEEHRGGH